MLLRKGIEVVITALTRNQVCGNASWVRIPLFPPKNSETRSVFPNFFFVNCGIRTGWKSACKRYNIQQQKQADQTTDETVVCNPGVIATL